MATLGGEDLGRRDTDTQGAEVDGTGSDAWHLSEGSTVVPVLVSLAHRPARLLSGHLTEVLTRLLRGLNR